MKTFCKYKKDSFKLDTCLSIMIIGHLFLPVDRRTILFFPDGDMAHGVVAVLIRF